MRTSYTYSRHWDVETRQHELLGLDLGEGLPRTTLRYGAVVFPLYWGTWLLLFGFPPQPLAPLFLLPPLALTYYGAKRSAAYWRRTNLLVWAIRLNYLHTGVRPVHGRGRIPSPKPGLRLRARRLGEQVPQLTELPTFAPLFAQDETQQADRAEFYGQPAQIRPRLRAYGPDAVANARAKYRKKQRRSKSAER
ncbi:hypothetical protein [Streptomyces yaizuensis]|uniref:Conjugal transfer protein n=1 Tax=Streptomyces yaizuensis TaxID=2989713 RepID=A0ABQ5P733_9ACTN|nr:hypothetical protein [Streptomyces sp. YSPA8]GLF98285.1 hypothetical protein SYYSPA8_28330 [Streptomyces sp. YSPA8]